jgi:hypothetical protein
MDNQVTNESVIVSKKSFESDDNYDIIDSNISFLNALFAENLEAEEVSQDAQRSYYVDYYLAQVNNGGFSQFVYNSGWDPKTFAYVKEGLKAMGASKHLAHFEKSESLLYTLGLKGIKRFFKSDYFDNKKERDILNSLNDEFYALSDREDLIELNSRWLRGLPHLVVMSDEQMKEEKEWCQVIL